MGTAAPEVKDNIKSQDTNNGDISPNSLHSNLEVKAVADIGNSEVVSSVQSTLPSEVKIDSSECLAPDPQISENVKVIDSTIDSSKSSELNVQVVDKNTAVGDCQTDKADELVGPESSLAVQKSSSEHKHGSRTAEEEPSKSGSAIVSPSAPQPSQRKMVISVGKSSPTSSTIVISKPSSTKSKKDSSLTDMKNDDGRERPKKLAKDRTKSSLSSVLKTSHSSKLPHSSVSKGNSTHPKEPLVCSSSKASSVQNIEPTPESGESASSLQTESALHVQQNKITASGLPQRGGKINHSNSLPSSKANHTPMHPPPTPLNSHANLSDEEVCVKLAFHSPNFFVKGLFDKKLQNGWKN